jgi:hypothetical protein
VIVQRSANIMPSTLVPTRQRASALVIALIMSFVFGALVLFVVQQGHAEARHARFQLREVSALYEAYAEMEKARLAIRDAPYDDEGRNTAIRAALQHEERRISGTTVTVQPLYGDTTGTWFVLRSKVGFEDRYSREVLQPVREIDFFSSYLLFVDRHPVGISGAPVGAIHTNRKVEFHFPDGQYRYPVTAVEGAEFLSGATFENTELSSRFEPNAKRVSLDVADNAFIGRSLRSLAQNVEPDFDFSDPSLDVELELYSDRGEQWIRAQTWTRARIETRQENVVIGHNAVHPHEETVTREERIVVGTEQVATQVQVIDHYETRVETRQVPRYVEDVRIVEKPVYAMGTCTRTRRVWVDTSGTASGGTTVAGSGSTTASGYWMNEVYQEPCRTTEIDHYEDAQETYRRLDGYDEVTEHVEVPVYRTETQYSTRNVYDTRTITETLTVYDQEPIYELRDVTYKIPAERVATKTLAAPANGLIFVAGNVRSIQGDIVGRLTIGSEGSITITGNLVYRDGSGNPAFFNGVEPWLDYEANPEYAGSAALGLLARSDVLYSRRVPENLEINAAIASLTGRVGIEGVVLDESGAVIAENSFVDEYGAPVSGLEFSRNSIRRLGAVTTSRRPVETVVRDGRITSGFNVGQAVYDNRLLASPPPGYLALDQPRFFPLRIR